MGLGDSSWFRDVCSFGLWSCGRWERFEAFPSELGRGRDSFSKVLNIFGSTGDHVEDSFSVVKQTSLMSGKPEARDGRGILDAFSDKPQSEEMNVCMIYIYTLLYTIICIIYILYIYVYIIYLTYKCIYIYRYGMEWNMECNGMYVCMTVAMEARRIRWESWRNHAIKII